MALFISFALLVFSLVCFFAWLRNITQIASDARNHRGGMILARTVGIFIPPLGMLLGFIGTGARAPITRKEVRPWKR